MAFNATTVCHKSGRLFWLTPFPQNEAVVSICQISLAQLLHGNRVAVEVFGLRQGCHPWQRDREANVPPGELLLAPRRRASQLSAAGFGPWLGTESSNCACRMRKSEARTLATRHPRESNRRFRARQHRRYAWSVWAFFRSLRLFGARFRGSVAEAAGWKSRRISAHWLRREIRIKCACSMGWRVIAKDFAE